MVCPTVLAVHFTRGTLMRLNFAAIDPSESLKNFPHRMKFKKTSGFDPVDKITSDEQWVTTDATRLVRRSAGSVSPALVRRGLPPALEVNCSEDLVDDDGDDENDDDGLAQRSRATRLATHQEHVVRPRLGPIAVQPLWPLLASDCQVAEVGSQQRALWHERRRSGPTIDGSVVLSLQKPERQHLRIWLLLSGTLLGNHYHVRYSILFATALAGCTANDGSLDSGIDDSLDGGVVASFDVPTGDPVVVEHFRVWVTNPTTIDEMFAVLAGTSDMTIVSGKLGAGPGQGDHNVPWHWHLDPEDVVMASITIELCDAAPSYVEAHLDEYLEKGIRYCPWAGHLVDIVDHR
jgi:hypothetical protein